MIAWNEENKVRFINDYQRVQNGEITCSDVQKAWGLSDDAFYQVARRLRKQGRLGYINQRVTLPPKPIESNPISIESNPTAIEPNIDSLIMSINALPTSVNPPKIKMSLDRDSETAVLMISDIHVGQLATSEATGGLGTYNWVKTKQHNEVLLKSINKIINLKRQSTNVKKLIVCLLGDIVEGIGIFKTQTSESEFDVMKQILNAIDLLETSILCLAQDFEAVSIIGVPGNHGVPDGKKSNPFMVNFDYLIYKILEKRLSQQKNITCNFSDTWFQVVNIEAWKFLLIHGDDVSGSVMSESKIEKNWAKYQKMVGGHFDYMLMGHFHQYWRIPYGFGACVINGGWSGATAFTKIIKNASTPVQLLFFIHKTWGIVNPYPIYMVKKEDRVPAIKVLEG